MKQKKLEAKGEFDYDYKHDILFFKTREREYVRSLEFDNLVVDVDKQGFLVGIQIFEASHFFKLDKKSLLSVARWNMIANAHDNNQIEIRLTFQIKLRNKIVEKNPIILQSIEEDLPNSRLVCEA